MVAMVAAIVSRNTGKLFEQQLVVSFRHWYPDAYVKRNTDAVFNPTMSAKSPPDFQVVAKDFLLLCEAKATKGTSIAFNRLATHQKHDLLDFDAVREDAHGAIALLRYNGERGKARKYEAWLVPIREWWSLEAGSGRKSLPFEKLAPALAAWGMPWIPGVGFDVRVAVRNLS